MNAPLPRTAWTTGTTEVFKTGSWRSMLPRHAAQASPCHLACPVGGEIADWMAHAARGDFRAAWDVLVRHNPFPAIAGRVCHHPCESACNRAEFDEALSICQLERTAGDLALSEGWGFAPPAQEREQQVAVIGAGPSGLAAAYHLRRRGWQVTVFEAREQAGGVMRYGIPDYRLPRDVLDGEIARILAMGVRLRCNEPLATAGDLQRIRETHDAVYVAVGAGRPKRLPQLPEQAPWLMTGADYLAASNGGAAPDLGRRVIVIGGGSAALDVARSARRAGCHVTILALEPVKQMPAQPEEIAEALEEGVALADSAMLRQVQSDSGLTLHCVLVQFEPGTRRGEFTIKPRPGTEFELHADAVITAIGQDPQLEPFAALPAHSGLLATNAAQASPYAGVWAGGDVASMARFVTEAVGMGERAAIDIDRALRGLPREERGERVPVAAGAIATWYHQHARRVPHARRPVAERLAPGAEVQLPIATTEQAIAEASRCFSCGRCTSCDNCVVYCPDLAVAHLPEGGYTVLADYCKGCGVCVRECPTGSMLVTEERR